MISVFTVSILLSSLPLMSIIGVFRNLFAKFKLDRNGDPLNKYDVEKYILNRTVDDVRNDTHFRFHLCVEIADGKSTSVDELKHMVYQFGKINVETIDGKIVRIIDWG